MHVSALHMTACDRVQMALSVCREEHFCRFCQQQLPDWQRILTPHEAQLPAQCLPTMSVTFNDQVAKRMCCAPYGIFHAVDPISVSIDAEHRPWLQHALASTAGQASMDCSRCPRACAELLGAICTAASCA